MKKKIIVILSLFILVSSVSAESFIIFEDKKDIVNGEYKNFKEESLGGVSREVAESEIPEEKYGIMSEDLLELYILGRMMKEEDFIYDNMDYWHNFDEFLNITRFSNFIQNRKFLSSEFGINFIVKDFKGFDEFKNLNLVLLVLEVEENMDFSGLENLVVAEGTSIYYHARPFYQAHTGGQTYTYDEEEEKIFMDNWEELLKSASKINSFTKEIFYLGQYPSQSDVAIIKERKRWRELLTKYDRFDENGEIVNPDVYMSLEQNHNTYIVTQEFNLIKLDDGNYKIFYTFPFDKSENTGFDYNIIPMIETEEILIDGEEIVENGTLESFQTIEFIISKKDYEEYLKNYEESLENMWSNGPEAYRLASFYNPLMTISFSDEKSRENVLINLIPENEYINIAYDINNPNDEYDIELKGSLPEGAVFNEESMRPFYLVNKKRDGKTNIDNIELEKAGYKFNGWSNEKTGKNWDFKRDKTDKSMTLLANWIPEEKVEELYVNVTFVPNNGEEEYTLLRPKNRQVTEPNVLKEGYKLKGWSKSKTEEEFWDFNKKVVEDITLYAKWEEKVLPLEEIDITFNANGGKIGITETKIVKIEKNSKVSKVENPTREGFNFKGWAETKNGTDYFDFETLLSSDKTLYAKWSKEDKKDPEKEKATKTKSKPSKKEEIKVEEKLNKKDHFEYVNGYEDKSLKPQENISREEVAAIFFRLLNDDYKNTIITSESVFKDIEKNRWSNKHISTLSNGKIVEGYENGEFRPNEKITRAEVAVIASRFDKLESTKNTFTDANGHWAENYIGSASKKGWIKGYPDKTFRPDEKITRAELVSLVNNVLERKIEKENILTGIKEFTDLKSTEWYYEDMIEATNGHEYIKKDSKEIWEKLIKFKFDM